MCSLLSAILACVNREPGSAPKRYLYTNKKHWKHAEQMVCGANFVPHSLGFFEKNKKCFNFYFAFYFQFLVSN